MQSIKLKNWVIFKKTEIYISADLIVMKRHIENQYDRHISRVLEGIPDSTFQLEKQKSDFLKIAF
jgi:hypothetical protein